MPGRLDRFSRFSYFIWVVFVLCMACLPLLVLAQSPSQDWKASGKTGAVVAGGKGAVDAGLEILKGGGNAIDAAVATILALNVTDATAACFGGEVPIMVYDAKTGAVEVLAGQGAAPALATREAFAAIGGIPAEGLLSATVPATLDACLTALDRRGTITFAQASAPMLRLLDRKELAWHADLANTIRRLIEAERGSEGDRRKGLRLVADYFYRGPIAREISDWSEAHGGLLRRGDFAKHVTHVEEPTTVTYRGYNVYKCGVWTQGPFLLESLAILEGFDLGGMGHNSADAIHLTVEAMKLGMADRDTFHASLSRRPGDPVHGQSLLPEGEDRVGKGNSGRDTTTCLVVDKEGNVVAATPSGWSGVVAGETGVWLGTRLQSFNLWPGHPNCIEPGKRPRITLTPTIVTKDKKAVLAVSVAGGDNQDMMSLQLVINQLDFRLEPATSVTAPRFMSDHFVGSFRQAPPDLGGLRINPAIGESVLDALAVRGHKLKPSDTPLSAAATVIAIDPATGDYKAAGDPRAGRHAGAY